MAFRNVYIQNDVHIRIKNEQLLIQKTEEEYTMPLEDINSICIESQRTNITTYALKKFIEHDIVVYICAALADIVILVGFSQPVADLVFRS